MLPISHILASKSDEDFVKVLVGAVIAVLWIIGHLTNWVKNANSASKTRAIPRPPPVPPAIPQLKQALKSAPVRPVGKQIAPARLKPQQRPAAFSKRPVPPPLPPRARIPQPAPVLMAQPAPIPQVPRPAPAPRTPSPAPEITSIQPARPAFAASLNRWLQPNTLQKQFIITEIFQPPLALRESGPGSQI